MLCIALTPFVTGQKALANSNLPCLDLTGTWQAIPDKDNAGTTAGYFNTDFDDTAWTSVEVPCHFDPLGEGMDAYRGTCWFRRNIDVPAKWQGRRVLLHFEGVNNQAHIWINGQDAGRSVDPFLPHDLNVHHLLKYGDENSIAISVNNEDPVSGVPTFFGWRSEGGILRSLDLRATDWLYIEHVALTAEPQQNTGRLDLEVIAVNEYDHNVVAQVQTRILDVNGATVKQFLTDEVTLRRGQRDDLEATVCLPDAKPWSPDQPYLYRARVDLLLDGKSVEQRTIPFGFRRVETKDAQILLNGQPIYLIGFNRHEDSPLTGMATDLKTTRSDLLDMKRMGANFVRLCHYPHDPLEIDMCDEIGLLVMCEIPFYMANLMPGSRQCDDPAQRELIFATARRQMETMIRRDRNHPSVIFWSAGNECNEDVLEVRQLNAELVTLARRLDPSRLAMHVSIQGYWPRADLDTHGPDDVVGGNCYGYMNYGDNADGWLNEALATAHKKYPDKPIFITEFGNWDIKKPGDTPEQVGGQRQGAAIAYDIERMKKPYICGATIWVYADHRWPPDAFIPQAHGVSPYGVYTRDRRAGAAVPVCEKLFKEIAENHKLQPAATD